MFGIWLCYKYYCIGQHGPDDADYLEKTTDVSPAIVGIDLIDYSPTRMQYGTKPEGTVENAIKLAKAGNIIAVMWHWNAPMHLLNTDEHKWWSGFYTNSSTFDLKIAIDHPDSAEYKTLVSDMDVIAVQLKKFDKANVPVLWRLIHILIVPTC